MKTSKHILFLGVPCSASSWTSVVPDDTVIIPISQLLDEAGGGDFRSLAKVAEKYIREVNPHHIIAHDIGVTVSLLALLSLRKAAHGPSRLTLFNGAFSGFDIFKARHPIWVQFYSYERFKSKMLSVGVSIDPNFSNVFSKVKQLYRQIIVVSIATRFKRVFGTAKPRPLPLHIACQILVGNDDPYIHESSLRELQVCVPGSSFVESYQGHFPYLSDVSEIRKAIENFDK